MKKIVLSVLLALCFSVSANPTFIPLLRNNLTQPLTYTQLDSNFSGTANVANWASNALANSNSLASVINDKTGTGSLVFGTGATLNSALIPDNLTFAPIASPPTAYLGKMWYDQSDDYLAYYNSTGFETAVGRQVSQVILNNTGSTLTAGQAVYINGGSDNHPTVALAKANSLSTANAIGIIAQDINTGSTGMMMILGRTTSINTSLIAGSPVSGATIYVSPSTAGGLTTVQPTSPNFAVRAGFIVSTGTSGTIFTSVRNVYSLGSNIVTPVNLTAYSNGAGVLQLNGFSAGQTANLLDVYNYSGGTDMFKIAANGNITATGSFTGAGGSFTTLSASSTVSGAGFSAYLASPPSIGSTTAAAITGTTVKSTTALQSSGSVPTLSSCGSSPTVEANSNNNSGKITMGTGTPTACTVTFSTAYPTKSFCTVTLASSYAGTYYISANTASAFTITLGTGINSTSFNYTCIGN